VNRIETGAIAAASPSLGVPRPSVAGGVAVGLEHALRTTALIALTLFVASIPAEDQFAGAGERLSLVAGMVAAVGCIPALALFGRRHRFTDTHFLAVAYAAVVVVSAHGSPNGAEAQAVATTTVQLVVALWLIAEFGSEPRALRWLAWAYVFGAAVVAARVIGQATAAGTSTGFERFAGSELADPNDTAQALAVSVPLTLWLVATGTRRWARPVLLAHLVAVAGAVVLTGSRGGAVALLAGAIGLPLVVLRAGRMATGLGVVTVVAALVLAPAVLPAGLLARATGGAALPVGQLATLTDADADGETGNADVQQARAALTVQSRSELLRGALRAWSDESPLTGLGAGADKDVLARVTGLRQSPHNTLASVGLQFGLAGVSAFCLFWLSALLPNLAAHMPDRWFAVSLVATAVAVGATFHAEDRKRLWIIAAFLVCHAAQSKHLRRHRRRGWNRTNPDRVVGPWDPLTSLPVRFLAPNTYQGPLLPRSRAATSGASETTHTKRGERAHDECQEECDPAQSGDSPSPTRVSGPPKVARRHDVGRHLHRRGAQPSGRG
jgi:hypothetical protein